MPQFKNVSPLGALELPLVARVVAHGEVIQVTPAQAAHLVGQADWELVDGDGEQLPDAPPSKPPTEPTRCRSARTDQDDAAGVVDEREE